MAVTEPACGQQLPVDVALAGGTPQRVGGFRFFFADERWEWSPEAARIHGYEPDSVTPTTDLVMSHKHPDDLPRLAAALGEVRRTHKPISNRHRIIDVQGQVHDLIVIGDYLHDDDGAVIGIRGYYVDVTPSEEEQQDLVTEAVAEIAESRGAIEQTKGMLRLIYRVDASTAFELLKWRSQKTNVKLRLLAEQLSADFLTLNYDETLPNRSAYDNLLMTAHLRINNGAVYEVGEDVAS